MRDRLIERLNDTNDMVEDQKLPKTYLLSSEFMLGRRMKINLVSIGLEEKFS